MAARSLLGHFLFEIIVSRQQATLNTPDVRAEPANFSNLGASTCDLLDNVGEVSTHRQPKLPAAVHQAVSSGHARSRFCGTGKQVVLAANSDAADLAFASPIVYFKTAVREAIFDVGALLLRISVCNGQRACGPQIILLRDDPIKKRQDKWQRLFLTQLVPVLKTQASLLGLRFNLIDGFDLLNRRNGTGVSQLERPHKAPAHMHHAAKTQIRQDERQPLHLSIGFACREVSLIIIDLRKPSYSRKLWFDGLRSPAFSEFESHQSALTHKAPKVSAGYILFVFGTKAQKVQPCVVRCDDAATQNTRQQDLGDGLQTSKPVVPMLVERVDRKIYAHARELPLLSMNRKRIIALGFDEMRQKPCCHAAATVSKPGTEPGVGRRHSPNR